VADWVSHPPSRGDRDGEVEWEISFYEDILKRHPSHVDALKALGNLYTSNEMYSQGLRIDQRLVSLRKDDPIVHYNLGCSYSLLRRADEAFRALQAAIELGYGDLRHMEGDDDLDNIRTDPRYAELIARVQTAGHFPGGVAADEQAPSL